MLYNQDVNIKVSGGYTRTQQYRSFKLKASKVFDGQNRYNYPFFPQKPYIRSKTLLLHNGGNDVWRHGARFIDPALETIIQRSGIDLDVQSYVPVIEYVNGNLRGVFNLREPNNDDFAYANWGYDDEELDAFENMTMKNGDDVVIKRICELGKNATDAVAYEELKTLLDIDEFTNYMAVTLKTDTKGARLFVNGLEVPYADFNGHLFAPVTLRAEASAGYRFAGWKQGSTIVSTEAETSLPSGTVSLTATFTRLSDSEMAAQGITTEQDTTSERIYNLNGQAVQGMLAPGVYIVNGRKIIKK